MEIGEVIAEKKPGRRKWLYTVKYRANRSIEIYNARLVAMGYAQT